MRPRRRYASLVTDMDEWQERIRVFTEQARRLVAAGADPDQVAQELLHRTGEIVTVIKAVADATGIGLGEAKFVVHRNLDPEVRAAAERLWAELLDGLAESGVEVEELGR